MVKGLKVHLNPRDHFEWIVLEAIEDFAEAESQLANPAEGASAEDSAALRYTSLRKGGAAALYLHHFTDIVAKRPIDGLPNFNGSVGNARTWLSKQSIEIAGTSDVTLLKDVADALKHSVLTIGGPREVEEAGQVLVTGRAYESGRFGEGKFGNAEAVWILGRNGKRALISVLRSVSKVWGTLIG